jgi:hypothetical protein
MSFKFALIVSRKKNSIKNLVLKSKLLTHSRTLFFLISANQIEYFRYFSRSMIFKFRSTSESSVFRQNVAYNSKDSTKFYLFFFIDDFLFFVRDMKIISSNVRRMCRCSFSSFAFRRRHYVDASIISKEFRLDKRFVSRHCDVHRTFYALSNFHRVFFDMLTTIKRRKRDRISSKINKLFDINLFSRFTLSFDLQIHFKHDFDWYWYIIWRLINLRFNHAMY